MGYYRIEAQVENETTPAGSDDELVSTKVPHTPPRKKLKSSKVPKKAKLEPRELPFASDEKGLCLVLSKVLHVMAITEMNQKLKFSFKVVTG